MRGMCGRENIRNSEKVSSPDNNWNARKADFADLVERENPDVAGFQEVLPDQMAFLKERFPEYVFVGEFRNQDRTSGEASPVAFRKDRFSAVDCGTLWLSETPDEPGSKSWNAAYPRICSYAVLVDNRTGKKFCFANTHTDHRSEEAEGEGNAIGGRTHEVFRPQFSNHPHWRLELSGKNRGQSLVGPNSENAITA